ncbi:MAG TPA: hypothetical protein DCY20_09235 [Firmicutes bacterium]|nr:hypothetical protein [Bacillota bacterium]
MQNINAVIKESIIANAIKCEHQADFSTILSKLKRNDLKGLIDNHAIKGCSSLTKPKLIERLIELMSDEERLAYVLCGLDNKMESIFVSFVERKIIPIDEVELEYIQALCQLGYLYPLVDKKEVVIVLPDEVASAYQAMDKKAYEAQKNRYDLVYNYMRSLVNLYGVCEIDQLITVFNEYEALELSFDEVIEIFMCKVNFQPYVQGFGPLLVCDSLLLSEGEDVLALKETQAEKPYYMPTKEDVMLFATGYGEMTPQMEDVKNYLVTNLNVEADEATQIMRELSDTFIYQYEPKLAFMILEHHGIQLENYDMSQEFMRLLIQAYNHTRIWENRGFRPAEITPAEGDWLQNEKQAPVVIPTLTPLKSTKVGRNDPCTCGSGKKFKKCCGR